MAVGNIFSKRQHCQAETPLPAKSSYRKQEICRILFKRSFMHIIVVFDYPKNLTLFDTECKKALGSSLLVIRFDYSVWCATFDLIFLQIS